MFTKRREPVTMRSRNMLDKNLPVFKSGRMQWDKVRQQVIANCPLPAILAATARTWPTKIRKMLDPSNDIISDNYVSWFDNERERARFKGNHLYRVHFYGGWLFRITPLLYYNQWGKLIFAESQDGGGWVSYIEKAYAVWRGKHRYENLDASSSNPPTVDRVLIDVNGPYDKIEVSSDGKPDVFLNNDDNGTHANDNYSLDYLKNFLSHAKQRPTIATTYSDAIDLIGNHCYVVLERQGSSVKVWEAIHGKKESVSLNRFFENFNSVYQSRAG